MAARLGAEIEFVQKQLSSTQPSAASRRIFSFFTYSLRIPPYIPHACEVWSSERIKRIFGRSAGASLSSARAGEMAARKPAPMIRLLNVFMICISYYFPAKVAIFRSMSTTILQNQHILRLKIQENTYICTN